MWKRGVRGRAGYQSWQFPTVSNPGIDPSEIEDARGTIPADLFAQEYLAEFRENVAGVFRMDDIEAMCVGQYLDHGLPGREYVAGWDVGQKRDFSVLTIGDVTDSPARVVAMWRETGMPYPTQIRRISDILGRFGLHGMPWNVPVWLDVTNNDALVDGARDAGLCVHPVHWTGAVKGDAIRQLQVLAEQHTLILPDDPVIKDELDTFQYSTTPSGNIRYAAANGHHDDIPMSLALIAKQLAKPMSARPCGVAKPTGW
jgi:phage FluMu gp28-like protein